MIFNNRKLVEKTPILTNLLFEGANVHQLWRMWTEHSALGQSALGWIQVHIALWLWWNFYRVVTPDQKWARISTSISIAVNALVIISVLYFRFFYE